MAQPPNGVATYAPLAPVSYDRLLHTDCSEIIASASTRSCVNLQHMATCERWSPKARGELAFPVAQSKRLAGVRSKFIVVELPDNPSPAQVCNTVSRCFEVFWRVSRQASECSIISQWIQRHWSISSLSLLLSVTGGAQPDLSLPPKQMELFARGLGACVDKGSACVITGGTDRGIILCLCHMDLTVVPRGHEADCRGCSKSSWQIIHSPGCRNRYVIL